MVASLFASVFDHSVRVVRVVRAARRLAMLGAVGAFAAVAAAATAADVPGLRLPRDVVPLAYAPTLKVDPDQSRFDGTVAIRVRVDRATDVVWLNARDLAIHDASATLGTAAPAIPATVLPGNAHVVGLKFATPLPVGEATLRLSYTGVFDAVGATGVFRQQDGGRWYVYTQFEPLDARRAFPCFDEPDRKATWQLTLVVPEALRAFANMPVERERPGPAGWREVRFEPTPLLPSYLVAFAVGDFDVRSAGTAGRNKTPISIIAPKGRGAEAAYAVANTGAILEAAERYFGMGYPFPKLDLIAYPRSPFGSAMENPGLITYTARNLLARPEEETQGFRQRFTGITAHEIAHLWFGDYVTMVWWDDLWLNEAFASWLASKLTAELHPEWDNRAWPSYQRSVAMESDRLASARRIRQPVTEVDEVRAAFDNITYAKGQSVLTMFEEWLGPDKFREGVRRYVARYPWGNATAEDFFAALAASDAALVPALRGFVERAGVPLVDVALDCGATPALKVTQARFRPVGMPPGAPEHWVFPACFEFGDAAAGRQTCALVKEPVQTIPLAGGACPQWVVANRSGIGYFLPRLSPQLYGALPAAAKVLAPGDYEPLLADVGVLARNGDIPYALALQTAARQADNTDGVAAHRAFDLPDDLPWELVEPANRPKLAAWIRAHYGPRAHKLGWAPQPGEPPAIGRLRQIALPLVALRGADPALAKEAQALAARWLADRKALPVEMRKQVLRTAARTTPEAAALHAALLEIARTTADANERDDVMLALGSFQEPALLRRSFALAVDPALPLRESIAPLRHALQDGATRATALAWMGDNIDALVARAPAEQVGYWPNWAAGTCSREDRARFVALFEARAAKVDAGPRVYRQSLEKIDACLALRAAQEAPLNAFLAAGTAR